MISARFTQPVSSSTAILIRLVAAFALLATIVIVPMTFASAAFGRVGVSAAFETAAIAVALALVTALAARGVDPLHR